MNADDLRQVLAYYRDLGIKQLYERDMAGGNDAAVAGTGVAVSASPAVSANTTEPPPASVSLDPVPSPPVASDPRASAEAPASAVLQAHSQPPAPQVSVAANIFADMELPSLYPPDDTLEKISADIGDCRRCRLHQGRHNIVFGVGDPNTKLVFVGEGPGQDEDLQGIPFVGRAGQLLTAMIENTAQKEGIPLKRADVYICNVVKCRPPDNRTPEPDEMEICGQFLFRQLAVIRPKAICALGGTAAKALLGRKEGVTKMRGNWFKWTDIPVMVTYHPSFLLRAYNKDAKREAWEDLKKLFHFVYD